MTVNPLPPPGSFYRLIIKALIASIAATVLIGIAALVVGPDEEPFGRLIGSSSLMILLFGAAAATGVVLRRGKLWITVIIGLAVIAIGIVLLLTVI